MMNDGGTSGWQSLIEVDQANPEDSEAREGR